MPAQPFLLGVNYWPRRKAMYWWSDFDLVEVQKEFDQIHELGLKMVRIFLLWEDWQPTPDRVDPQALDNLGKVCDTAAERGLKLNVTFFTGHMSGPSWAPGWLLRSDLPVSPWVRQVVSAGKPVEGGYLNPFEDPAAIGAAELQLRTVVSRYKDHPALGLWDLGNEPDLFARPATAEAGRAWVRRMTDLIHEIDPVHPVTCGLHEASLLQDNGLRVDEVFAEVDQAVMHGYPMYADWSVGPLDPDFVPFLCALTSALCGKPTLMQEFGGCTAPQGQPASALEWTGYGQPLRQFMASEEGLAAYVEEVLPKLVEVGALGALLWCYADYDPELYQRPPCEESWHERSFGLVRPDGSLKPHAEVVRRFAATNPRVQPARRQITLTVTPEEYYRDPAGQAKRAYRSYLDKYAFTSGEAE
ncbi:MAG: glycoside hydrolase family 2 TIM barrel-domain containing protein [Anaerolineales bacterium]|jgi:endo-1,4-beta-mannosidase